MKREDFNEQKLFDALKAHYSLESITREKVSEDLTFFYLERFNDKTLTPEQTKHINSLWKIFLNSNCGIKSPGDVGDAMIYVDEKLVPMKKYIVIYLYTCFDHKTESRYRIVDSIIIESDLDENARKKAQDLIPKIGFSVGQFECIDRLIVEPLDSYLKKIEEKGKSLKELK